MKKNLLAALLLCFAAVFSLSGGVFAAEPKILVSPAAAAVDTGSAARLTVLADGEDLSYQWWDETGPLVDGAGVGGAVTDTLLLDADCADDGRRFFCVVSNPYGSVRSGAATLTVRHVFDRKVPVKPVFEGEKADCERGVRYYLSCRCGEVSDKDTDTFEAPPLGHTGGTATCSKLAVCERCGKEYGTLKDHSFGGWQYDADRHWRTCSLCGTEADGGEHLPGAAATRNAAQTCLLCGYVIAPPLGHVHRLTYVPEQSPTCTEPGHVAYYSCSCKKRFADSETLTEIGGDLTLPPLGHDFGDYVYNGDASCMADGTETAVCARCGEKDTRTAKGSALGHSYGDYVYNNDASCEADGTETASCVRCDVTVTRPVAGTRLGHDFGNYVYNNDASCEADGTETAVCDRCGKKDTRTVKGSAPGHRYGSAYLSDGAGHWRVCAVCGAKSAAEAHVPGPEATGETGQYCLVCRRLLVPARDHVHRLTAAAGKEPTCTEPGIKTSYVCDCGRRFLDAEGTEEVLGEDDLVLNPLGHRPETLWHSDGDGHWRLCSRCGARLEEGEHSGGTADHRTAAVCSVCGGSYGDVLPHVFERVVDDAYLCAEATCISQALYYVSCSCGERGEETFPFGPLAAHDFSDWGRDGASHWPVCAVCGEEGEAVPHVFEKDEILSDTKTAVYVCVCGAEKREDLTGKEDGDGTGGGKGNGEDSGNGNGSGNGDGNGGDAPAPDGQDKKTLPFTDVASGSWYYDDVVFAYENGLIRGVTETLFAPAVTTSRAMVVTILFRLESAEPELNDVFDDVAAASWYGPAVNWAAKNGIVKGYSPNTFGPDDPVTREQMVTILHRYALWKGVPDTGGASLSGFPDGAAVASWAAPSMSWAVGRSVIFGTKRGNEVLLDPRGMTTRAQAAAIFHRAAPLITADKQLKGR
ncbi:MAG: S-layer homology domain-containing protein [Bacillota bacterium]|jgi:hypothetical protein